MLRGWFFTRYCCARDQAPKASTRELVKYNRMRLVPHGELMCYIKRNNNQLVELLTSRKGMVRRRAEESSDHQESEYWV